MSSTAATFTDAAGGMDGGRRRHVTHSVKTLKKALKKAGLKVSGKKATLTRRARKARLIRGGGEDEEVEEVEPAKPGGPVVNGMTVEPMDGGRRRRSRKSKGFRLY